jgi:hypothetical protein
VIAGSAGVEGPDANEPELVEIETVDEQSTAVISAKLLDVCSHRKRTSR